MNLATAKTLALDRMLDTYQRASRILVLSMDLCERNPSDDLEAMTLLCSKWMRRLWTLEEGVLGSGRLHVLFEHGPVNLSSIIKNLHRNGQSAPWTEHAIVSFATRFGLLKIENSQGRDRISWIIRDLNRRSTSVASEEALVFANLTGLCESDRARVPHLVEGAP